MRWVTFEAVPDSRAEVRLLSPTLRACEQGQPKRRSAARGQFSPSRNDLPSRNTRSADFESRRIALGEVSAGQAARTGINHGETNDDAVERSVRCFRKGPPKR